MKNTIIKNNINITFGEVDGRTDILMQLSDAERGIKNNDNPICAYMDLRRVWNDQTKKIFNNLIYEYCFGGSFLAFTVNITPIYKQSVEINPVVIKQEMYEMAKKQGRVIYKEYEKVHRYVKQRTTIYFVLFRVY